MNKTFCDCCGKEVLGQSMPISIPCHHMEDRNTVSDGYSDSEGNHISSRYESFDLCNRCSNLVFHQAAVMINKIRNEHKG